MDGMPPQNGPQGGSPDQGGDSRPRPENGPPAERQPGNEANPGQNPQGEPRERFDRRDRNFHKRKQRDRNFNRPHGGNQGLRVEEQTGPNGEPLPLTTVSGILDTRKDNTAMLRRCTLASGEQTSRIVAMSFCEPRS